MKRMLTYKCGKERFAPFDAKRSPTNSHGIYAVAVFGGKQNTLLNTLKNFGGVLEWINHAFHRRCSFPGLLMFSLDHAI